MVHPPLEQRRRPARRRGASLAAAAAGAAALLLLAGGGAALVTGSVSSRTITNETIRNAEVTKATIRGSDIAGSSVSSATVEDSRASAVEFSKVTIRRSDLREVDVERAKVEGGTLRGPSQVRDSTLDGVRLEGNVQLCRVRITGQSGEVNTGCPARAGPSPGYPPPAYPPSGYPPYPPGGYPPPAYPPSGYPPYPPSGYPPPAYPPSGYPPPYVPGGRLLLVDNGGAGPYFDTAAFRGKAFADVPRGTIERVCAYAQSAGGTLYLEARAYPTGPAIGRSTIRSTEPNAWACAQVGEYHPGGPLFLFRTGGDMAVGYDYGSPGDSRASYDRGATWIEEQLRRGYRLELRAS